LITRSFKASIVLWAIATLGRTVAAQPSASQQNRLKVDSFELERGSLPVSRGNYASTKGRVLEGNGVEPDVVIAPTIQALLSGCDVALDAASEWWRKK